MNEYEAQAKEFLKNCNATMKITYLDCEQNEDWNDKGWHNTYRVTIKTPLGKMQIKFWDSIYNTQNGGKPNEYDILACLEKCDVGDIEDFIFDFGYEIKKRGDLKRIQNIYNAVKRQYKSLCRCFTPEQIEAMQEIQ